jgi:hypothetical protein
MGGENELFLRPHIFRPVWAELRHRRSAHINDRVLLLFCIHLVRNAFDVYHRLASGPTLDAVFPPLDKRPIEIGIKVDLLALRVLGEVPLLEYDLVSASYPQTPCRAQIHRLSFDVRPVDVDASAESGSCPVLAHKLSPFGFIVRYPLILDGNGQLRT